MTKLIGYVNDKGGHAQLKSLEMPVNKFKSLLDVFENIMVHEEHVTVSINNLYEIAFKARDYTTSQFMQWYIEEQIEEESTFRSILDKFRLAGNEKGGLFHIDKELSSMTAAAASARSEA
jgi:ferritin